MKKSIVRLLAIGMLLGGAVVPSTVANDGFLSPVTTTQTAKAATTDQEQTIDFDVLKTGTNDASISSKYFNKTAKITPNGDGTYKVTIQVEIPTIASVNILTMGDQKVTDSDKYKDGSNTYQDISFNINDISDLNNKLNSSMQITVMGLGLMKQTADFKFDMSTLTGSSTNNDSSKDTDSEKSNDTGDSSNNSEEPTEQETGAKEADSEDGTAVTVGNQVDTSAVHYDDLKDAQNVGFSVLKQGTTEPSVSTQYFNETAKVTKNDDGTYKVTIQVEIPSIDGKDAQVDILTMGDKTVTESEKYTTNSGQYKDISFNVKNLSELDKTLTSSMKIVVASLGLDMSPEADFKFDTSNLSDDKDTSATNDKGNQEETNPANTTNNDGKGSGSTSTKGNGSDSKDSQQPTKTAKITPNGDGTYKVTIQVKIPTIASVDILTMDGKKVTDSDEYKQGSDTYQDISFNINSTSDLKEPLNSTMKIQVFGMGLMNQTADFKFDMDSLETVESGDTDNGSGQEDKEDDVLDPTQIGEDSSSTDNNSSSQEGSSVVVADPESTDSSSTSSNEEEIPYQVLKADPSQGESVSTQFFTGTAKVSKNDDGTYKVTMTLTYPTTFGEQPVTIDSINGGSTNAADTKTYSKDGKNFMDFSFNIQSKSALDELVPCTMTIDVSQLGFNSTESVNFKFNATSSGVAGASSASGTNGSGVYGSTSDWPSSATSANPSTTNSTLPQTGNSTTTAILTAMGISVAAISAVLFRNFYKAEFDK